MKNTRDLHTEHYGGTITLLRPMTEAGRDWLTAHAMSETWQLFGGALAVEPRFVEDILAAAERDGLTTD